MTISGSGNVGIGTASPQESLHVQGTNDTAIRIASTNSTATLKLVAPIPSIELTDTSTSATDAVITQNSNVLTIYNNGSGLAIDSAGKVGIGTTAPDSNLEIYEEGANATRQMLHVNSTLTSGTSVGATLSYPASITSTVSGGTAISRVMNWVKIDADAANNNTVMNRNLISIDSGTTYQVGGMDLYSSNHFDASRRALFVHSSNVPIWFTAASNISTQIGESDDVYVQMALTTAGDVGIGTTSPDFKLDVIGSGSFEELLRVTRAGTAQYVDIDVHYY
jgi:hypothetical protein